ncbi:methyltransferase domain-containing protein [Caenimonas koreensis DSM 17982]|uniref:Methyltransferase domain-containing protein n=1 Tax=Caenimonas koreensis DSM 17982 TaxID=1121255 RepID=A0A844AZ71_9BURK|nr:class I SAM-dependent methyltransferase [Caenimonas koreensis]MRD47718.1 methyltransferase domain-containing protein [Caenimonas koreensis DSM 17982]
MNESGSSTPQIDLHKRGDAYLATSYSQENRPLSPYVKRMSKHLHDTVFGGRLGKLLDIGCGRGDQMRAFAELGLECSGTDIANSATQLASGFDVRVANLETDPPPFPAESFDFVYSKSVIEHMRHPDRFLDTALHSLKPGGTACILTPSWFHTYRIFYMEYTHVTPFTIESLKTAMTMAGFVDVEVRYFYQLPFLWRMPGLMPLIKVLGSLVGMLGLPYRPLRNVPWPTEMNNVIRFSHDVMLLGTGRRAP